MDFSILKYNFNKILLPFTTFVLFYTLQNSIKLDTLSDFIYNIDIKNAE